MIGGRVQRVETMIFILDLRTVRDRETDLPEAPHNVVRDLRQRMQFPESIAPARQEKSVGFFGSRRFQFEIASPRRQRRFQFGLRDIDRFARRWFLLFRKRAELLDARGELAVARRDNSPATVPARRDSARR